MNQTIGIDCQKILSPTGGGAGIEHYIYHLVLNLAQISDPGSRFKLYFNPVTAGAAWIKNLNLGSNVEIKFWPREAMQRAGIWPYGKYRRQAKFLLAEKLNLFHGPANVTPLFYNQPTVVTVHDLIIYDHPEWFPGGLADYFWRHSLVPSSIRNASQVIAVSQATKKQIVRQFDVAPGKIAVIYEGVTTTASTANRTSGEKSMPLVKMIGSAKFLLYIGTIEPRKNLIRLIEAFAAVSAKFPDIKLVLAGKFGWKYESILASAKSLHSRVIFTDYVSAEQKNWLYQHALGFVYPSLAEGFGLPVLDAMVNRLPVLTSKVSSLPEVAGSAAIYVDPLETQDIAAGIEKLLGNEELRQELIVQGAGQASKFSWTQAAQQTLAVYQEIINQENA